MDKLLRFLGAYFIYLMGVGLVFAIQNANSNGQLYIYFDGKTFVIVAVSSFIAFAYGYAMAIWRMAKK